MRRGDPKGWGIHGPNARAEQVSASQVLPLLEINLELVRHYGSLLETHILSPKR